MHVSSLTIGLLACTCVASVTAISGSPFSPTPRLGRARLVHRNLRLRGGQGGGMMEPTVGQTKVLKKPEYMPWHQVPDKEWRTKDGCEVVRWDAMLEGCKGSLQYRYGRYKELKQRICDAEGSLEQFAENGYKKYGVRRSCDPKKPGIVACEWAPGAKYLALHGDFNGWNRGQYPYQRDEYGCWNLFIPDNADGTCVIPHDSRYKIAITT